MTAESQTILAALNLRFAFDDDRWRVDGVSLELSRGQLLCVVGPNGAGKSTLLRLIVGLLKPTHGHIELNGRSLDDYSAIERAQWVAYLPQSPASPDGLSVEDLVRLGRHPHRRFGLFESSDDMAVVASALDLTQMSDFADRLLTTLSGGEAQRAHLSAALAQQPRLLVLDEPTANLDLLHQLRIFGLLRSLTDQQRMAVIAVTHDLSTAQNYADRVLLLDQGRPAAFGTPDQVLTAERLESVYHVQFETAVAAQSGRTCLLANEVKQPPRESPSRPIQ